MVEIIVSLLAAGAGFAVGYLLRGYFRRGRRP